jgi:hypothetical protein
LTFSFRSDFKGKSKASPTAEDDLVQDERVRKDSVPAPDPSEAISDWLFLSVIHDEDWLAVLNPVCVLDQITFVWRAVWAFIICAHTLYPANFLDRFVMKST